MHGAKLATEIWNSAWRKLWPGCVPEKDFKGFETDAPAADVEENAIVEIIS